MRKLHQCLNRLKAVLLCLVLLQAVSCWDGLNDMFDKNVPNAVPEDNPDDPAPDDPVEAIKFIQSSITAGGIIIYWEDPASVVEYDHILADCSSGSQDTLSSGTVKFEKTGLNSSTEYTVTIQAIGKDGKPKAESSFKVTPSGTYTLRFIYTAAELDAVRNNLNYYYVVMNDIDLSGYANWIPIGTGGTPFSGILDGQGYAISNLSIDNNTILAIGLMGVTNINAKLKNCNIDGLVKGLYNTSNPCVGGLVGNNAGIINNCSSNVLVTGTIDQTKTGGLAGYNSGTISSCYSAGTVNGTADLNSQTGGLVGYNTGTGVIINCSSTGTVFGSCTYCSLGGLVGLNEGSILNSNATGKTEVTGTSNGTLTHIGGLVGVNLALDATITRCYASGQVTGNLSNCRYGGLVGTTNGEITDSYAVGNVSTTGGSTLTGGLAGHVNNTAITNCYAKGVVSSSDIKGGLVGYSSGTCTYTSCYYDSQTTGQNDTGKGEPRTTNQMKVVDTYSGWDSTSVWAISSDINGGYPYLRDVAP